MTCGDVRERLDGYAGGELAPAERAALAEHLAACAACRAEAAAWRELHERVAVLPRSIEPPRDLWPAIDRAIDPAVVPLRRRPRLRPLGLVAAGVALVLLTATLTTIFLRTSETAMARKLRGLAPAAETGAAPSSEELLRSLEARNLPPETIAIVERNLAVIDVAIAELEAALAEDPGNQDLARMLVSTYRKRSELIRGAERAGEGG